MLRISAILIFFFLQSTFVSAQSELKTHQFYLNGEPIDFHLMIEEISNADVVLFGEFHDHAMIHWLQLKTAEALMEKGDLVIGGEFFETDDQLLLDELFSGKIPQKKFENEAKLWPNYKTDYKPIIQLALDSQIAFIATNIPRRYASYVAKNGLDSLITFSNESKELMPELPVPFSMLTPGYSEMLEMMGPHGGGKNAEFFVQAQALKDYTMAYNIGANLPEEGHFLHINGDFHSADFGGVYWYLHELYPDIEVVTIKSILTSDISNFDSEWIDEGNLILLVPEDFTRTH